jgi:hypothetical protein
MTGATTPALLSTVEAAAYLGLGINRFRRIIKSPDGPRMWCPDGGRPMFAVRALDEWAAGRDDRQAGA